MRLTLRTLLAYLDNTLEPQDAEALRQKVEQSGFATQLIQRIRGSVADGSLSAPSPESVHPIEEPNMMSNYLDSTLSPEQIAEIEKACLESLPHLAEAAACHQILTMVLGRPAEASDQLRGRVLAMVDSKGRVVETSLPPGGVGFAANVPRAIAGEIGPRYSNIDLSEDGTSPVDPYSADQHPADAYAAKLDPMRDDVDLAGMDGEVALFDQAVEMQPILNPRDQAPREVKPVGVDDSGVFQAATKLREQSRQFAGVGTGLDDPDRLAGDRPLRQLERSDLFGGQVRTSRITPWIVSLALVATLLFAISQIFAPLLGQKKVAKSVDEETLSQTYPDVMQGDDGDGAAAEPSTANDAGDRNQSGAEMLPAPEPEPLDAEPGSAADLVETGERTETVELMEASDARPPASDANNVDAVDALDASLESTEIMMEDSDAPPLPPGMMLDPIVPAASTMEVAAVDRETTAPETTAPETSLPATSGPEAGVTGANVAMEPALGNADLPDPGRQDLVEQDPGAAASVVAKLVSDQVLVALGRANAPWALLPPASTVNAGDVVVCGPEYRASFESTADQSISATLVGPTEMRWMNGPAKVNVGVRFGRGILKSGFAGSSIGLTVDEMGLVATSSSDNASLAFEISHRRQLGSDPMVPENHHTLVVLTSVTGAFSLSGFGEVVELPAGSHVAIDLSRSEAGSLEVAASDMMPPWIDPEVETGSLESEAASDLLELVRTDGSGSLMLSLRVALGFRRNEVAALAGKTMLALGDASAYFGVDGLFSDPRQRLYWTSHLDAVREMLDRGVREAAFVRTAIAGQDAAMDNADGDTLFRILTGYSQEQLANGGDAELIAGLESASLPVRVLASEHLRDISGTTLFFKPEEQVASRREEVVKKWKVRLRKESIRYPEAE